MKQTNTLPTPLASRIARISTKILSILLLAILSFILILPVILSPLVTSTPAYAWVLLVIFDIAIVVLSFRLFSGRKRTVILLVGLFLLSVFAVAASQFFAATPPIKDEKGNPLPGSIATLEKVNLNGTEQWITIRGKNINNPVLLYLGIGGPGAGGFPATFTSLSPLEDHFVVVNWDQPGTGKSYSAVDINTLTPQRFVEDAKALSELMRQRFGKDKIYVMGLSWGTIVGTNLVKQYPDLFYAYIGNGQMVNTVENDRFGYNLAVKISEDKGNTGMANKLKQYGPPPYNDSGMALKYADYNNVLFDYMDSPNLWMIMLLVPQLAREYGYVDKVNFDLGLIESFQVLYPQLTDLDFTTQAAKVEVPMFFIVGRKDVNAVASIVERYYNILEAPYKELIWLESGHGATSEEIESALVNHVLPKSAPKP